MTPSKLGYDPNLPLERLLDTFLTDLAKDCPSSSFQITPIHPAPRQPSTPLLHPHPLLLADQVADLKKKKSTLSIDVDTTQKLLNKMQDEINRLKQESHQLTIANRIEQDAYLKTKARVDAEEERMKELKNQVSQLAKRALSLTSSSPHKKPKPEQLK